MLSLISKDILRVAGSLELRVTLTLKGNGNEAVDKLVELNTCGLQLVERQRAGDGVNLVDEDIACSLVNHKIDA